MRLILFVSLMTILVAGCRKLNPDAIVTTKQFQVPVLKQLDINPVLFIKTENEIRTAEHSLKSIIINLSGTDDLHDIDSVKIYALGADSVLRPGQIPELFGKAMPAASRIKFHRESADTISPANFLVSLKLSETANLHRKVSARCTKIIYEDNSYSIPTEPSRLVKQRIGAAVRKHMDDNVHTYRIPGLATTNKGTLLAIYDVRRQSSRDLQGDMDIGLSRSTDDGNTWEPMRIGLDMKEWGGLPEKFNGVSDACILVDKNSDKIFLAGLWMHGVINDDGKWVEGLTSDSTDWNHQWRTKGSQPGFGVKQTSQFLIATSTDDGITWSDPVNITTMCKKEEWWLWAPAPGQGITMSDGILVFPTQGRDENGQTFSNITFSIDGGENWETSSPAFKNTTENMVVQLTNGDLMLNARYNPNRNNQGDGNGRVVVTTKDLGNTWEEHPTSRSALIESTCMASIHKHVYHENGEEKSILLFSNPNTKTGRFNMTIKVSFDDGKSWPEEHWLLLDEGRSYGYSCLTSIDENTIGILYEGSRAHMTFESIPLREIIKQ